MHIVSCLEDAIGLVELYCRIFFYTPLEFSFDKLLAEDLNFGLGVQRI